MTSLGSIDGSIDLVLTTLRVTPKERENAASKKVAARIAEDASLYGYNPDQIGDAIRNRWKNES